MAASAAGDAGSGNAGWDPLLLLLLLLLATATVVAAAAAEEEARTSRVAGNLYSPGQSLSSITLSSWDILEETGEVNLRRLVTPRRRRVIDPSLLKGEIRVSLGHETAFRAKKGKVVLASISEAVPQLQPLVYNGGLPQMAFGPGTDRDPPQLMIKWQRVGHLCGSYPLPWSSLLTAIPTGTRSNRWCIISLFRSAMCLSVFSGPLMDVMTSSESMYRSSISHPDRAEILGNEDFNGRSHILGSH